MPAKHKARSYSKQELRHVDLDMNWWREFGKPFGWSLHGFTGRLAASFISARGEVFSLLGNVAEDILRAERRSKEGGSRK